MYSFCRAYFPIPGGPWMRKTELYLVKIDQESPFRGFHEATHMRHVKHGK